MATPDNRLRFDPTRIDFETDVGVTGQDHDEYPAPGQQPRFDWFRMYLIALLSCQSSTEEPTQYREGSYWFDLTTLEMKVRRDGSWVGLAAAIGLGTNDDGSLLTLADWFTTVQALLTATTSTAVFNGSCNTVAQTVIPIPEALRASATSNSRPLVYKNGLLVDPRLCAYSGSPVRTSVHLTGGVTLGVGDTFTVLLLNVTPALFHTTSVTV